MKGRYAALEPLASAHEQQLWTEAGGEDQWRFLPCGPFPDRAAFATWQSTCRGSDDPRFLAVTGEDGTAVGMLALMRWAPAHRVVEVGHVWYGPSLRGTRAGTEAIALVMRHVFGELGFRRLEWKCDAGNDRSRRAAERLGFTYEGTFRKHMLVKGRSRDTAWFSITDDEWPDRERRLEIWLDPGNFDEAGRQITPLG